MLPSNSSSSIILMSVLMTSHVGTMSSTASYPSDGSLVSHCSRLYTFAWTRCRRWRTWERSSRGTILFSQDRNATRGESLTRGGTDEWTRSEGEEKQDECSDSVSYRPESRPAATEPCLMKMIHIWLYILKIFTQLLLSNKNGSRWRSYIHQRPTASLNPLKSP